MGRISIHEFAEWQAAGRSFELLDVRFPTRVLHQRSTDEGMSTEELAGQAEGDQDVAVNDARQLYEAIYER